MSEAETVQMSAEELASVQKLQDAYAALKGELGKVIVGQSEVMEELLIALFAGGIVCWWACRGWRRRC